MTSLAVTTDRCEWRFYQAHFTGAPVAECLTCRRVCVYWEEPEELAADCEHSEAVAS